MAQGTIEARSSIAGAHAPAGNQAVGAPSLPGLPSGRAELSSGRPALAVARWLMFGACLSIIPPIAASAGTAFLADAGQASAFLVRGDLLLVAAALGATALGELIGRKAVTALPAIYASGAVLVMTLVAIMFYSFMTVASDQSHVDLVTASVVSIVPLLTILWSGARCIYIAAVSTDD